MSDHTRHIIRGKVFVVGDNIDTDQIIPAKYLSLVPTIAEEYEKLGSYAMIGWPGEPRYVLEGQTKTSYPIIIGGRNFGCGSSREHAPIALGAAGCEVVVAHSFARIFFRNCIATGELYPVETETAPRLEAVPPPTRMSASGGSSDLGLVTGDEVEIDLDIPEMRLADGRKVSLKPLGDALPVIDAGGLFAYSRETGLLK